MKNSADLQHLRLAMSGSGFSVDSAIQIVSMTGDFHMNPDFKNWVVSDSAIDAAVLIGMVERRDEFKLS